MPTPSSRMPSGPAAAPSPIQAYDFSHDMNSASRMLNQSSPVDASTMGTGSGSGKASATIIPFNLGVVPTLSVADPNDPFEAQNNTATHTGLSVDLNHERLVQLQLDASDYVSGLDHTLTNLHEHGNSRLVRRLKEASGVPLTFLYFRTQQELLKLSGDLTIQRERDTLNKLTSLMEH